MRLLYCVQRYGEEVGGGAEAACRSFAERMAARGHRVEVLTSCAVEYTTWANWYAPGTTELNGVVIHRLPVVRERATAQFGPLSERVLEADGATALAVERDWVRSQGPDLDGLEDWLTQHAPRFDVVVFYPYLYSPTALGLPIAARHTATVMHPAAHDEPMIDLRAYDAPFHLADGLSVQTPEEAATLRRRFGESLRCAPVGLGVAIDPPPADGNRFRRAHGLGNEPIMLFVGRVEPSKGIDELVRFFLHAKERVRHQFKLVLVGPLVEAPPDHTHVITTGFVDEQTRLDALAASHTFVMPSYFESFSIALCEAWTVRKPALVNANCATLAGQARRSGGGLGYHDYAEFEQSLVRLASDQHLYSTMGSRARDYVTSEFRWPVVLDRYERLLTESIVRHRRRRGVAV